MPKSSRRTAAKAAADSTAVKPAKSNLKLTPYPAAPEPEQSALPTPAAAEQTPKPPKVKYRPPHVASAWQLTRRTSHLLRSQLNLFAGIALVYAALNLILVQGLSGGASVGALRNQLSQVLGGHPGAIGSSITVFASLLSPQSAGSSNNSGAYQFVLFIVASLAIIWALRQVNGGAKGVRVRDAFYRGMAPFIPFILVLIVIGLELIPLLLGSSLYTLVVSRGVAVGFTEIAIFGVLFAGLSLLTLYMLSSTFLALYAVALTDATPSAALLMGRLLVRGRRLSVFRKVAFLPLIVLLPALVILLPAVFVLPGLAQWLFFLLTVFALLIVHSYLYVLYIELAGVNA